ncbi:MAG: alpha/beta fold hydrolase [Gemmatimonadales bacterium]
MSRHLLRTLATCCLTAVYACGGGAPPPPPPAAQPTGAAGARAPGTAALPVRVVNTNGTAFHYVDFGSGIPVVFVHGSLGTLESWRAQLDPFARQFRVLAYSRRYHPPNPQQTDGRPYTLARHAEDLAAFIERLGLDRPHIVGSSYGAYVALELALRRPELARSLVLGEPPILPWLGRTDVGDSLGRAFDAAALAPARRAFARGDSVNGLRRFVDGVNGTPGSFDQLSAEQRAALLRLAFEMRLELRADPAAYMPALACRDMARIRSPVLLVVGERSLRLFHVITEELERCLATEQLVSVAGASHAMHAVNPAAYNAAVLAFLTTH